MLYELCRLQEEKMTKLKSPNFHVSRTRLVVYNLPKSMTEKQLKKLFIDAVTSRATKQKPMIRQVSYLDSFVFVPFLYVKFSLYPEVTSLFSYCWCR
jgi:RNA recognition motif-containing protein